MALVKSILKSGAVRAVGCWLGAQYIRFVYYTSRWQVEGRDDAERLWAEGKPFVVAFWHGRLLLVPYAWPKGRPVKFLISQHRDGELISRTIGHLGLGSIRGSARNRKKTRNKGGAMALRTMMKSLDAGECVGITPDGPKGPRMRASSGVVAVARMSGAPVIPLAYSIRRRRVLGSWDRFILGLPFSRGAFVWGRPIDVPRDLDEDAQAQVRERIESALTEITARADALVGHAPIEPDPVPRGRDLEHA